MIDAVRRLLRQTRTSVGGLAIFSELLVASASETTLATIGTARLVRFAEEAFTHVGAKPYRGHSLRIRSTDLLMGVPGAPASASVIEILDDDMPYLVESVSAEINRRGLSPLLVFHPIFKVSRYGSGRLTEVLGPGDRNWQAGNQESFMAVVIDAIDDDTARELTAALDRVLTDVRHAAVDTPKMRARLLQACADFERLPLIPTPGPADPSPTALKQAMDFLNWLDSGNFTLLGMRDYELVGHDGAAELWPASGGALGVLRQPDAVVLRRRTGETTDRPEVLASFGRPEPVLVAKADSISRVRQCIHLDYVGVKRYNSTGKLIGELRIVGLFTRGAYLQPLQAVPIVGHKVQQVLAEAGYPPDSHNGRTLLGVLEDMPRDELLHIDVPTLAAWSAAVLELQLQPRTRVLARLEQFHRYVSVLTFVPRDLYSTTNRERIGAWLAERLGGRVSAFFPYYTAGPLIRTRFIIGLGDASPLPVDDADLEAGVVELLRTWPDRLQAAIGEAFAGDRAETLTSAYRSAFSAGYEETFDAARAVEDIQRIERLDADRPIAIDFHREPASPEHRVRAAIYRFDVPIPLSERVPVLESFGFRVIDERSYRVKPVLAGVERAVVLHDMVLETANGQPIDIARHELRLEDAFLAVTHGHAENDAVNALVIAAGLDWHEASVFRAYAAYMRQIRAPFSPRYIAETLARHASIATDLFELFRMRFATAGAGGSTPGKNGSEAIRLLRLRIETAMTEVASLDEDRILRRLLNLMMATVRTSFYQPGQARDPGRTIAFKFDARQIDELPEPKPHREVFVYSPRVEGVHLRFAAIARGGIRWSDRAQDFRTEVLGLAKAQEVKNTVIVASGAKGGFVPKRLARDAPRDVALQEGIACYRLFISALLSLTDDLRANTVVHPDGVVRHDSDDPYLVVAADKGTATFSDFANEIATARGFWLGDAFASGGSAGYDHKRMGITARGAWECVRRHFRELGHDIQQQPFRVVGVGDMSGDVFGNAMQLSPAILLVGAFDHRDIFIDPTPDAGAAHAERQRLFEMPRSSWADYDRTRISAGGGVFSRQAKSIQLTPEIKRMLRVEVAELTPNALIVALLRATSDLLWFGGIGTFVRASAETDDQVGDRGNDAIRITAEEVGARVIGEGANLGITQRGRIEAARRGIRLNTDFIDNSAGVNTSDQEVNIKIALAAAMAAGRLEIGERDRLLASMTDDVAAAVLTNNYRQSLALSLAERTSARDIELLGRLARRLEERGLIERKLEALPSGAEFAELAATRGGLTRPELSVLLSWAKIALTRDLLAGQVPDDPANELLLLSYFPPGLRGRFSAEITSHRLRREIIATTLTNSMINRGGPAFVSRIAEETGSVPSAIAEAYLAVRSIFALPRLWASLDALDSVVAAECQLDLYQQVQDLMTGLVIELLRRGNGRSVNRLVAAYGPAVAALEADSAGLFGPAGQRRQSEQIAALEAAAVPPDVAVAIAALPVLARALEFTDTAVKSGATPVAAARIAHAALEYFTVEDLLARAATLKRADEFDAQAIRSATDVIAAETEALGAAMLASGDDGSDLAGWISVRAPRLAEGKATFDRILSQGDLTISRLTVAADAIRGTAPRPTGAGTG